MSERNVDVASGDCAGGARFLSCERKISHVGQVMIYLSIYLSTVDDLDHNLPFGYVMKDLFVVQILLRKHVLTVYRAGYTAPTRQHALDHTDHTDQRSIYLP